MPSAEDLIKKVISNNTVNVQIMTPELEKKLEDMEERQTEQHEESIETQKKTKEEFKKISNQGSSNFKEGGEMINKGIKGLTGVDLGGKFNTLKDKVSDLGNIFKGFGKLIAGQTAAEGLSVFGADVEAKATERLEQTLQAQIDQEERQRKAEVAARIQREQEERLGTILTGFEETFKDRVEAEAEFISATQGVVQRFTEGEALSLERGVVSQDKVQRDEEVNAVLKDLEKRGVKEDTLKNVEEFLKNTNRLVYELRASGLQAEGQLEVGDPNNFTVPDGFGGLRLGPDGKFIENPRDELDGLFNDAQELFNKAYDELTDKEKLSLLNGTKRAEVEQSLNDEQLDALQKRLKFTNIFSSDQIKLFGGVDQFVQTVQRNAVQGVETLRNTFEGEYFRNLQERGDVGENLQNEIVESKTAMTENVNDEQTQMIMNFLSNLPPILAVLQDTYQMDESQRDKLFGGQKDDQLVDMYGNPLEMGEEKLTDNLTSTLAQGGRGMAESIAQGVAMGGASAAAQKSFGGQKPNTGTGGTNPKGTVASPAAGAGRAGGILGGIAGMGRGLLGLIGGTAGAILAGLGLVGGVVYANTGDKDDQDMGEGDTDYAKERLEKREQDIIELQGEDGFKKGESIVDINRMTGPGSDAGDFFAGLLSFGTRKDTIDFDLLDDSDALLRLDQLMSADDLVGENLSEEQRKQLDEEIRNAQTAAQEQLAKMQEQTGERLTLEELQKLYDFEVLGENVLSKIQPNQAVTDNSVINNNTTITGANPRQYDVDVDRAQTAYT